MAKNFLGEVRRTQVLDYGPGAIIDFRAGGRGGGPVSALAGGLEHWDATAGPPFPGNAQSLSEPRLEARLSVKGFRLPPVDDRDRDGDAKKSWLVGARFPTRLQCPSCNEVKLARRWDKEPGDPSRWCVACSNAAGRRVHVIPVRFVTACERGHLDEFPWDWWLARANHKETCRRTGRMRLENRGSIGLSGLFLVCNDCGAGIAMEGVFGEKTLAGLRCRGRRPWLGEGEEECDATPRVLQRGASNLYFPIVVSALSIPPWSDRLQGLIGVNWSLIVDSTREERSIVLRRYEATFQAVLGMSLEEVLDELESRVEAAKNPEGEDLKYDEYRNLTAGSPGSANEGVVDREFEVRQQAVPESLAPYIEKLARVVRLREVRALKSFSRIYEPASPEEPGRATLGALSSRSMEWLPAIEVRGEGIFLSLNRARVREWETDESIRKRAAAINAHFRNDSGLAGGGGEPTGPGITPRRLLLHSLAHALLRYVSLECGYETASIRERIYDNAAGQEMSGILIYTSSSDSEGTLGGLARQAEPDLFANILRGALEAVSWCSSDPLCINGITSTSESYNWAACHSCLLVPETSCELFNRFLDRTTLVGNSQDGIEGYFDGLVVGPRASRG